MGRTPAPGAQGPLANPEVAGCLVLSRQRAQQAQHRGHRSRAEPAGRRPRHGVLARAHAAAGRGEGPRAQRVVDEQAAALARKEGEASLAAWQGHPSAGAALGATVKVSRAQAWPASRAVVDAVLQAPRPTRFPPGSVWISVRKAMPWCASPRCWPRAGAADPTQLPAQYAQSLGRCRDAGLLRGAQDPPQGGDHAAGREPMQRARRASDGSSRSAIIFGSSVAVAQLVESRIVIPVVVGSSPISHPNIHAASSLAPENSYSGRNSQFGNIHKARRFTSLFLSYTRGHWGSHAGPAGPHVLACAS